MCILGVVVQHPVMNDPRRLNGIYNRYNKEFKADDISVMMIYDDVDFMIVINNIYTKSCHGSFGLVVEPRHLKCTIKVKSSRSYISP